MLISICGKSGAGKSTISKMLIDKYDEKIAYLDIDKISHKSLIYAKEELISYYGNDILSNNEIDRKKLGKIVFNDKIKMDKLTDITWKYMENMIDKFINNNKDKIIVLDWQLLTKTKYFSMSDIKVLLDIPYEIRKKRAIIRDNITEKEFDLREKASVIYNKEEFNYILKDDNDVKRMVLKI